MNARTCRASPDLSGVDPDELQRGPQKITSEKIDTRSSIMLDPRVHGYRYSRNALLPSTQQTFRTLRGPERVHRFRKV
jgi:hypothetical protein